MKESQKETELVPFLKLIEGANSVLEIGSRYGETLLRIASVCAPGARLIALDLPNVQTGRADSEDKLLYNAARLRAQGFDAQVFIADSHSPAVKKAVEKRGPFDVVFIDGDHSEEGVQQDWEFYGPMGKIVAFHDAASDVWHAKKVWNRVKSGYRYEELFDLSGAALRYMGIGVLWRS